MDRWLAGLKGTLNLWDAHRVKVYNKEFRAEHPEYFDPDGILVFCGPQGSGKTLSMIQYAYRLSLAYPDMIICTNVELHDWPPVRDVIQWEGMKQHCNNLPIKYVKYLLLTSIVYHTYTYLSTLLQKYFRRHKRQENNKFSRLASVISILSR